MADLERLVAAAREARSRAYCPYSGFAVGAAVLAVDGTIHTGCNVENAAYGETICAERVALAKAVSEGRREVAAIAVVAAAEGGPLPCGACLQVIAELAPTAAICLAGLDGGYQVLSLADLLPRPFRLAGHPTPRTGGECR